MGRAEVFFGYVVEGDYFVEGPGQSVEGEEGGEGEEGESAEAPVEGFVDAGLLVFGA